MKATLLALYAVNGASVGSFSDMSASTADVLSLCLVC